jgi:single-strand selective monofunctional uracil DNA glycosylase
MTTKPGKWPLLDGPDLKGPGLASSKSIAPAVLAETAALRESISHLDFSTPITHVYNPLEYAWDTHRCYVEKWGGTRRRVLLLGMNPGPWGMAQTGVPFGEVAAVTGPLAISGEVRQPENEHPKRPVTGLATTRSEVSGRRLWGFFLERFGGPEGFFREHMVLNYCPLVFMEESGRNFTPDKLPAAEAEPLFAACDQRLLALVDLYRPIWVVGVGGFARKKLEALYGKKAPQRRGHRPESIGTVLHPSPASPAANRGWAEAAEKQMLEQGVWSGP